MACGLRPLRIWSGGDEGRDGSEGGKLGVQIQSVRDEWQVGDQRWRKGGKPERLLGVWTSNSRHQSAAPYELGCADGWQWVDPGEAEGVQRWLAMPQAWDVSGLLQIRIWVTALA